MRTILFLAFIPLFPALGQKALVLEDRVYEPQIKTVLCYAPQPSTASALMTPSTALGRPSLVVEFDDLQEEHNNYSFRIIHCNHDWTKSDLMDLDILTDYNEFPINDYSFSINTHIPYLHYRFQLPQVKISGNFVVFVFRDGDRKDIILSKRFMVFENRVYLASEQGTAGVGNLRSTNQALNFKINYGLH